MTESVRGVSLDRESVNGAQDWSYDGQTSSAEKEGLNTGPIEEGNRVGTNL